MKDAGQNNKEGQCEDFSVAVKQERPHSRSGMNNYRRMFFRNNLKSERNAVHNVP